MSAMPLPPWLPGIPRFENRGDMFGGPGDFERAAVDENEHDRFAGGADGFEQFFLTARELQRRARGGFAAHQIDFTQHQDGDIAAFRERYRVVDRLCALRREFASAAPSWC